MKKKQKTVLLCYIPFLALALVMVIGKTMLHPVRVEGVSMNPTYHTGELLATKVVDDDAYSINDVIVINRYAQIDKNVSVIKRIVGLPGDRLVVIDGLLYRNGEMVDDELALIVDAGILTNEIVVPAGCVFVMGDNRNHSVDSRVNGVVSVEDIYGVVSNRLLKN